eukprot:UN04705
MLSWTWDYRGFLIDNFGPVRATFFIQKYLIFSKSDFFACVINQLDRADIPR